MRLTCIFFLSFVLQAKTQQAPQWGNLKPGPYAIGYTTIRFTDNTRQYFGPGRPLQVYMWYPAAVTTGQTPMKYGDYFEDVPYDWGNDPEKVARLKNYFVKDFKSGSLNPSFPGGIPDSTFEKIRQTTVPVHRNATAAPGKFPVLLHAHANGLLHQSLMMEFLASQGYVVMSVSLYGSSPAFYGRGEDGAEALTNLTQDLALVLEEARKLGFADTDKTAMVGMMAQAGLSLQMKAMPLKAIACLDCTWNTGEIKKLPYYDPRKIRIPIMELVNTEFVQQQFSYLDSLPFAERFIGRFHVFPHADFYPFPKIARPAESHGFTNYEYLLVATVKFLNSVFKEDEQAKAFRNDPAANRDWPAGYLFFRKKAAQPPMPTEGEFLTWLRYGEMDKVNAAWKSFGKTLLAGPDNLFFIALFLVRDNEPHAFEAVKLYNEMAPGDGRTPGLLTRLGYGLMDRRQFAHAQQVFEFFAQQFPISPYAYNGLADALVAQGDKTKAREQAKKVIELLQKAIMDEKEKQLLLSNAELILSLK